LPKNGGFEVQRVRSRLSSRSQRRYNVQSTVWAGKCSEGTHIGGGDEGHICDTMLAGHGSPLASSYNLAQCLTKIWFGKMLTEWKRRNKQEGRHSPVPIWTRNDGQRSIARCSRVMTLSLENGLRELLDVDNENDVTANETVL